MTFVNVNPRRRRKNYNVNPFFNLVNDVMNTSISELEKSIVKTRPAVNVIEGKEDFKLEIAAPGLSKSDFELHIEKDVLTISAKVDNKDELRYSRREFNYNEFKRTFHLPETVDTQKTEANFLNGILTVTLAKKEEAKEMPARNIEVK